MNQEETYLTKKEKRELKKQQEREENKRAESQSKFKKIIIWLVLLIGAGSIIIGIVKSSPSSSNSATINVIANDRTKGIRNAKVVLVEYSDFQCPACGYYYNFVSRLEREDGDKFLFVYRHYPLPQHKNAKLAAYAAEAAGKQGKFWEMHDILFENQKVWSDQNGIKNILLDYAKSLKLDLSKFEKDLDAQDIKDKVSNDQNSGDLAGINATPTFFLNGKKLDNPQSYDDFKKLVENEIAKKGISVIETTNSSGSGTVSPTK